MTIFIRAIFVGVFALLFLSGCATQQAAIKVNAVLEVTTLSREQGYYEQLRAAVIRSFESKKAEIRANLDKKEAEVLLEIQRRTQTFKVALTQQQITRLEDALRETVDELNRKLETAQQVSISTGNREEEIRLALQLTSILTAHARTAIDIANKIENRLMAQQEESSKEAIKAFKSLRESDEVNLDPVSEADAVLTGLEKNSTDYKAAVKEAHEGLGHYIVREKELAKAAFKGFVGKDLFKYIEPKVDSALNKLSKKADQKISSVANKLVQSYQPDQEVKSEDK